jgi:hypothetical protein
MKKSIKYGKGGLLAIAAFLAVFVLSGCANKNTKQLTGESSIDTNLLNSNESKMQDNSEAGMSNETPEEVLVKQQLENNNPKTDASNEDNQTSVRSASDIKNDYEAERLKDDEERTKTLDERATADAEAKRRDEELVNARAKEDEETRLANAKAQAAVKLANDKKAYESAIERLEQDYNNNLKKLQREKDSKMQDLANRGLTFSSEATAVNNDYESKCESLGKKYKSDLKTLEAKKYW